MDKNYNSHSTAQYNSISSNFEKIRDRFKIIADNHKNLPDNISIKILDIGCAHGGNSIKEVNNVINVFRKELPNKVIEVFHADLPVNDFTKLFLYIKNNENTYVKDNKIFSYAIGNSYENQLVPDETMDYIFSFNCLHWVGPLGREYYDYCGSMSNVLHHRRPGNENYYKERLASALKLRYKELKHKGILTCNVMVFDPTQNDVKEALYVETVFYNIKNILRQMHEEGIIPNKGDIEKMILPVVLYTKDECDYVIDNVQKECNGFNVVYKSQYSFNWKDTIGNIDDPSTFIDTILAFCGGCIKNVITGDDFTKNQIFSTFRSRLLAQYKLNPSDFEFSLKFLFLSFFKE